jgi:putative SOS response-associated peptidase YedK
MCGRYYRKGDKQKIVEAFHANLVDDGTPSPPWDYNLTNDPAIIRNNRDSGERELVSLRWGLIPFFTKDIKDVKGISTINARAKTGATSRTYREPSCQPPASTSGSAWTKRTSSPSLSTCSRPHDGPRRPVERMEGPHKRTVAAEPIGRATAKL